MSQTWREVASRRSGSGRVPLSAKQAALKKGGKIHLTSLGLSQTMWIIAQNSNFFVVLANGFGGVFVFVFRHFGSFEGEIKKAH